MEVVACLVDIIIGTSILAVIPLFMAAYGAHLATEAIVEPKRRSRIKIVFWALFVVGVLLTIWQQYRAAVADQERATRGTWADALALRQLQPNLRPPLFAYSHHPFAAPVKHSIPALSITAITNAPNSAAVGVNTGTVNVNPPINPYRPVVTYEFDGLRRESSPAGMIMDQVAVGDYENYGDCTPRIIGKCWPK